MLYLSIPSYPDPHGPTGINFPTVSQFAVDESTNWEALVSA